jgi:hypothetical protein
MVPWTRLTLMPDDDVTRASIGFTTPLGAFYAVGVKSAAVPRIHVDHLQLIRRHDVLSPPLRLAQPQPPRHRSPAAALIFMAIVVNRAGLLSQRFRKGRRGVRGGVLKPSSAKFCEALPCYIPHSPNSRSVE